MKKLEVRTGHFALVDDKDFTRLKKFTWFLVQPEGRKYAKAQFSETYLHRLILGISDPKIEVDHRNGNGLDCRRQNLRACSRQQNSRNAQKWRRKTSSKFKGVCWCKTKKRWKAYIVVDNKQKHLIYTEDERIAAEAYDIAAKNLFGEFARTNFQ
jgi:hypothetical protein